jgi:hypothetical protein
MKNKIKLEDITPEKLEQIDNQLQDLRLTDLTLNALKKISKKRKDAFEHLASVEAECHFRVLRAYNLGFSKRDLADIFNVTTRQIGKWVGE